MKIFIAYIFFLLPSLTLSAQQANKWIFGDYATLDFNFDPPREFEAEYMDYTEASSSICDEYGKLVLYTNGLKIYNSNHQLIAEGLAGDITTSQTCLIMPHPSNRNIYYVFTASSAYLPAPNINPGYHYSIVDLTLNEGKGGLLKKNILLHHNGSEKLTAIQSTDCKFSWILTQEVRDNLFYAYRFDEEGVHMEAVISPGGKKFIHVWHHSIGALKISPDGSKVAHAVWSGFGAPGVHGWLEIFDFDIGTGKVSNPTMIFDSYQDSFTYAGFYSVAFSPNSKVLYACHLGFRPVQVDLTSKELEFIYFTEKPLRRIEAGPKNKLYAILDEPGHREGEGQENLNGYGTTISAIHEPNQLGEACQFESNYVKLKKGYTTFGLPNFPQSFFYHDSLNIDYSFEKNCLGEETQFSLDLNYPVVDYWWKFGDPGSGVLNTSYEENPKHLFEISDNYQVQLHSIDLCLREDIVTKDVIIYPNPSFSIDFDTLQRCYFEAPYLLDLPRYEFTDYFINNEPGLDTIRIEERGNYQVTLKNECYNQHDQFFYDLVPEIIPPLATDTFFCKGDIGILSARNDLATYLWNTGKYTREIEVYEDGDYAVQLNSACQTLDDFTNVKFIDKDIESNIINVFTPNGDNINEFFQNYAVHSPNYRTRIVNRWGNVLFETDDPDLFWDGFVNQAPAGTGVYFYITETMNCHAEPITIKGAFSLLK